jgi:hypothetical protein
MNLNSLSKLDLTQEHKTFNQLLSKFTDYDNYLILKQSVINVSNFTFETDLFIELKINAIELFIMKFIQQYIILDDIKDLKEYVNNYQSILKVKINWSADKSNFLELYNLRLKFADVRSSFAPIKPKLDIIIFQTNIQKEILGHHYEIYNFNRFYPQDYEILEKYNQEAPAPRNYVNFQDK